MADVLVFEVGGTPRECPVELWECLTEPRAPRDFTDCDGCTASPEHVGRFVIWPACRNHDWRYSPDGPNWPRFIVDLFFRVDVWRLVRIQDGTRLEAAAVASPYWIGVLIGGARHFKRKVVTR